MVVKSKEGMPPMSCTFLSCSLIQNNGACKEFYAALGKSLLFLKIGEKMTFLFLPGVCGATSPGIALPVTQRSPRHQRKCKIT